MNKEEILLAHGFKQNENNKFLFFLEKENTKIRLEYHIENEDFYICFYPKIEYNTKNTLQLFESKNLIQDIQNSINAYLDFINFCEKYKL